MANSLKKLTLNREDYKTAIPLLGKAFNQIIDDNVIIEKTVVNLRVEQEGLADDYANYKNLSTGYFEAIAGDIQYLDTRDAYIGKLQTDIATMGFLDADSAVITDLQSETAKIENLTAEELSATVGYIGDLTAGNVSASDIVSDHGVIGSLNANYAHITSGVIDNASIDYADVENLSTHYAQIDGANITTATMRDAWVDKIMVQTNLIASDGTVFYLDAIKVNATNITAGTIDVERIVVTDSVTGEKHLVTWNESTHSWESAYLDGEVIEDLTITADKIVAGAITADKITTQNIVGTGGWINLRNGTFAYVNAQTGNGISWDGARLNITADSLHVGNNSVLTDIDVSVTQTASGADITINGDTVSLANGATGATGATGVTGATGATGNTGATGAEALVTVYTSAIDWAAGTATLVAKLLVDGIDVPSSSWQSCQWSRDGTAISGATSPTYVINSPAYFDYMYSCTVNW